MRAAAGGHNNRGTLDAAEEKGNKTAGETQNYSDVSGVFLLGPRPTLRHFYAYKMEYRLNLNGAPSQTWAILGPFMIASFLVQNYGTSHTYIHTCAPGETKKLKMTPRGGGLRGGPVTSSVAPSIPPSPTHSPLGQHGALESATPGDGLVGVEGAAQAEVDRGLVTAQEVGQVRLHQRHSVCVCVEDKNHNKQAILILSSPTLHTRVLMFAHKAVNQ